MERQPSAVGIGRKTDEFGFDSRENNECFGYSDCNSGHSTLYQVEFNTLPAGANTNGHIGAKLC